METLPTISLHSIIQYFLSESVKKVCGIEHLTIFNTKCGVRVGSNWKGYSDFETCVAKDYFLRNLAKDNIPRKNKSIKNLPPVTITTTSEMGVVRTATYMTPKELAEVIVCELPEESRLHISSAHVSCDGRISITTHLHFEWHGVMGRYYCPHCGLFLKGERGLRTHQVLVHNIEYEEAYKEAYNTTNFQVISHKSPEHIIGKWKLDSETAKQEKSNLLDQGLFAAKMGNLDELIRLIETSSWNPHTVADRNCSTALFWAAGEGHLHVCKYLSEICQVDVFQMRGKASQKRHPLHWAARNGHVDVCKWLVCEKNVDVNIVTEDGTTSLHFACYTGQYNMVKWLIEEGKCDVHSLNSFGCNASQWCAINGSVKIMKYLHDMGLDCGIINKNGHSALHKAAIKGNIEICQWLVGTGEGEGNLSFRHMAPDQDGFTPLLFAHANGHLALADWLRTVINALNFVDIREDVSSEAFHSASVNDVHMHTHVIYSEEL